MLVTDTDRPSSTGTKLLCVTYSFTQYPAHASLHALDYHLSLCAQLQRPAV